MVPGKALLDGRFRTLIMVRCSPATSGMSRAPISIRSANPFADEPSGIKLDFAMPIELDSINVAFRDAHTTQCLAILLEHREDWMRDNASALLDHDVIVTNTVEAVQETGKRGAGLSEPLAPVIKAPNPPRPNVAAWVRRMWPAA